MRKKRQKLNFKKIVSGLCFFVLSLPLVVFLCYELSFRGKIYPGIMVLGIDLSGLTQEQAAKAITAKTSSLNLQALEFKTEDNQIFTLRLENLEFKPQETAQKAFLIGRKGNFFSCLREKFLSFKNKREVALQYQLNQKGLDKQIEALYEAVFVPTIEPSITLENQQITIDPGREGKKLDRVSLKNLISKKITSLDQSQAELPLTRTSPAPSQKQIESTRKRAENLLGKKIIFKFEELNWTLDDKQLVQFLSFTNGFDEKKIASILESFSQAIDRPPENAAFEFKNQKVTQFRPAKEGRKLDKQKTTELLVQSLELLEKGFLKVEKELPVLVTQPQITTADANNFGIKELIGQGESYFKGSASSRIHNINLASSKLNGIIIPPEEIFSFNKALGEISSSTGYQQAFIIKDGKTILGDGGGVCQTSTTLFRAALNAGLEIIERKAHAYRVSYYEQNSPVGLDATVFAPTTDLKFKNNTPAYILIQTEINIPQKHLVYKLYGTDDKRKVIISKPKIWDQVPPPPDLYQNDPTLAPGEIKQIEWKAWGAKVSFDYRVEKNGEILFQKTFYSNYRPWQAVFLRGSTNQ